MTAESILIEEAAESDAGEILALQKLAFQSEAALYADFTLPPLVESLDAMRERFADHVFLKAVEDGRIIGSVRAFMRAGTCHIGRLVVLPGSQGRGIATRLMRAVEDAFPQAHRFEVFTGHKSARVLSLYTGLGYTAFDRKRVGGNLELVFLEKYPDGSAA